MIKTIPFSPPDISQLEIDEVVDTLKSGWITTGPKTKKLENEIANYCQVEKAVCLNSATAGLELSLRLLDIGEGDEVITTPYTYAATANVILHVGAKPVFVDIKKDEFNIDPTKISEAITSKTKAIIPVDFAGWPVDYDEIKDVLENKKHLYSPKSGTWQKSFDRPIIIADSAHAFGATYKNKKIGSIADFTCFSFHAVKNLTTAEGGAVTFNSFPNLTSDEIYKKFMLLSLHGQSKDALSKTQAGSWQYTIEIPGFKCNMTDIMASLGLAQLKRYETELIPKRKTIFEIYKNELKKNPKLILPPFVSETKTGSFHIYPIRIINIKEKERNEIIQKLAKNGISVNVHFIPVVMHPAYTKLGYNINNFPNTYNMYQNEISLPVYSKLSEDDALYIGKTLIKIIDQI